MEQIANDHTSSVHAIRRRIEDVDDAAHRSNLSLDLSGSEPEQDDETEPSLMLRTTEFRSRGGVDAQRSGSDGQCAMRAEESTHRYFSHPLARTPPPGHSPDGVHAAEDEKYYGAVDIRCH